ncbi:hypothetical protein SDJN03_16654, partial [Cucurbita argyrosperma subsp. sororia]
MPRKGCHRSYDESASRARQRGNYRLISPVISTNVRPQPPVSRTIDTAAARRSLEEQSRTHYGYSCFLSNFYILCQGAYVFEIRKWRFRDEDRNLSLLRHMNLIFPWKYRLISGS